MEEDIQELILNDRFGTLDADQISRLAEWRSASSLNEREYQQFLLLIEDCSLATSYYAIDVNTAWDKVDQQISVKPMRYAVLFPYKFAAACILILSLFGLLYFYQERLNDGDSVAIQRLVERKVGEGHRAIMKMPDGIEVDLSAVNGVIIGQDSNRIASNNNGVLQMGLAVKDPIKSLQWVEIFVPNGNMYKLRLSDGTHVVLNAGSRLRYPIVFGGKDREVELTGEAFFDVTHDRDKVFSVETARSKTEVLGTAFNVNSYNEEETEEITLVRGRVRVDHHHNSYLLHPGNQLLVNSQKISLLTEVNLEQCISWMDGTIRFDELNLKAISQKLERCYGVRFVFKDKIAEKLQFTGAVYKGTSLGDFLKKLEVMTDVKFAYRNNTVEVFKK